MPKAQDVPGPANMANSDLAEVDSFAKIAQHLIGYVWMSIVQMCSAPWNLSWGQLTTPAGAFAFTTETACRQCASFQVVL
jgi:hypothetical protein